MKKIIYKKNSMLIFTDEVNEKTNLIFYDENNIPINEIFENLNQNYTIFTNDVERAFNYFVGKLKYFKSSGGLVNLENKFLMIRKRGWWDLPKGKIENNENPIKTAIREVYEECNLDLNKTNIIHYEFINSTFHIFIQNNIKCIKETLWYFFKINNYNENELKPEKQEGIEIVKFLTYSEWKEKHYKNTYLSIADTIEKSISLNLVNL